MSSLYLCVGVETLATVESHQLCPCVCVEGGVGLCGDTLATLESVHFCTFVCLFVGGGGRDTVAH